MTILIMGGGILAYEGLGRLEDPEFTIKEAQIFTDYPGASAMEVAEGGHRRDRDGRATAWPAQVGYQYLRAGLSTVRVEMEDKYDKHSLPQVWDELRRKVNDIQDQLPPGAGPSSVFDDFGDVYGVFYAVYGDGYSYAELKGLRRRTAAGTTALRRCGQGYYPR